MGGTRRPTQIVHSALLWEVAGINDKTCHASCCFCSRCLSTSACMHAWCDKKGLDSAIHPIPKCVIFLEDLLQEMVEKRSKDSFGTIRVARKALSKIRCFSCCCNGIIAAAEAVHAFTGSFNEECLPPMVNNLARRP